MEFRPLLRFAFSLTIVFNYCIVFSQSTKVLPPTPAAMKMTEYYASVPNMYTGTANVSIPLHTINFDGWQIPLSISYNASGVRTNEEAGEIGLGWSLNATGVVSRVIKGGDDFFIISNGRSFGYVYSDMAVTHDVGYDFTHEYTPPPGSYYYFLVNDQADSEPDIFNYSFFGYSGSFVLTQKVSSPGGIVRAVKLTQDACSIIFNEEAKTFTVVTPEGFRGDFTVPERSTSLSSSIVALDRQDCCLESSIDAVAQIEKSKGMFRATSAWYLSKITSPRGKEMLFHYDLATVPQTPFFGSSYIPGAKYSPYISNTKAFAELQGVTSNEFCMQTIHEHIYLQSITSDELTVTFTMETRKDLRANTLFQTYTKHFAPGNPLKRFKSISIVGNNPEPRLTRSIVFHQSYFNQQYEQGSLENQVRWLRNKLDRVVIDDQEYRFNYEKGLLGLPDKLTRGIDHFGFYNGRDDIDRLYPPTPQWIPGCFISSLPDSTIYSQSIERRPNIEYGRAGLLSKVHYPTRGYSVFEFESHRYIPNKSERFREEYGTHSAGGARIKTIKDYNYDGTLAMQKSYYYSETTAPNSRSTGVLMTPIYNRYVQQFFDKDLSVTPWQFRWKDNCQFFYRSGTSVPGNNAAEGKIVGYSKVHEIVIGTNENYRNTFFYENRANKVLDFSAAAEGQSLLNGQLKLEKRYNSQGEVVQVTENQDIEHNLTTIKAIAYQLDDRIPGPDYWLFYWVPYEIKTTFHKPYRVVTTIAQMPSQITENSDGTIASIGNSIQTQTDYEFDVAKTFQLKSQTTLNSKNQSVKISYKRAWDYSSPSATLLHMRNSSVNLVGAVIEEVVNTDDVVTSATANKFELQNGHVNLTAQYGFNRSLGSTPTSTDGANFSGGYELKTTFSKYDPLTGKLQEYTSSDGVTNSIIWGFNGTLPIVHGLGIAYNNLNQAHADAISSGSYETALRSHALVAGKPVTTYDYIPLIGLKRQTDPTGTKASFEYDAFGRLLRVLDKDGNIVKKYDYHFRIRKPVRILRIAGDLNFGTVYSCKPTGTRTLTLYNDGEDELTIQQINFPNAQSENGFHSEWLGGKIQPGESVDVVVSFDSDATGNFSGAITIISDKTEGPSTYSVTGDYVVTGSNKLLQLSTNRLGVDYLISTPIIVTSAGDACLDVQGATMPLSEAWAISSPLNFIRLAPGESTSFSVIRLKDPPATVPTIEVTVTSNSAAVNNIVKLELPEKNIDLSPLPLALTGFTASTDTKNLVVKNFGNQTLTVTNVALLNPDSRFTISPTSFQVPGDGQQNVQVTYTPTDFNAVSNTIVVTSDKTTGTATISTQAQRTQVHQLTLSPTSTVVRPWTSPVYATLANTGNINATVNSVSLSAPETFTVEYYYGGSNVTSFPLTIAPGAELQVRVLYKANGTGTLSLNASSGNYTLNLTGATF